MENSTEGDNKIFVELGKKLPLTETEAKNRYSLIIQNKDDIVLYDLSLNLLSKNSSSEEKFNFKGVLEVTFPFYGVNNPNDNDSTNSLTNIFLNFYGYPAKVLVNDNLEKINLKDQKLFISNKFLNSGINSIKVFYYGLYSNQGAGLHHYTDPVDNKEYLYTQFEPYDCNRLFPVFDQPNIKAKLRLKVIAPDNWNIYSNEVEDLNINFKVNINNEIVDEIKNENSHINPDYLMFLLDNSVGKDTNLSKKFVSFSQTPRLSSYLFALAAGEYICYENTVRPDYKIKMRVMYRASLKQFADPDEMIKVTIHGIDFYEKYFNIKYPFNKYDQIFCPEYNMGAMENVGLVTYNEAYVWKSPPTIRRKNGFAITVLHELAHMWFGNLVTMDWWNDLWLNESFATFISHLALEDLYLSDKNGVYSLSWILFNYYKGSAYREDQAMTTHPVMGDCENTEVCETNFDSITYEKGSSILKQIYYKVGHENFGKAIHTYFTKYQYLNTVFDNFVDELENVSPNIKELSYSWLTKAGLTSITPKITNVNGKVESFEVIQEACLESANNLQTLIIDILLFYPNGVTKEIRKVLIKPETITKLEELHGIDAPEAVLLNYNDWAYVKLVLDKESTDFFRKNLNLVTDVLTRQMIYRSFFDMVRDAKLSCVEYVDLICSFLGEETSEDIVSPTLRYLTGAITNYLPLEFYTEYADKIFVLCMNLLNKFKGEEQMLMNVIQQIPSVAVTKNSQQLLADWLKINVDKNEANDFKINFSYDSVTGEFPGKLLNQEIRFAIVKTIYGSKFFSKDFQDELLEQEVKREGNSDESISVRNYCKGSENSIENKASIWDKVVNNPNSESLTNMEEIMSGFVRIDQREIIEKYLTIEFFNALEKVSKENDQKYVTAFVRTFTPDYFTSEEILKKIIDKAEELKQYDITRRGLLESVDVMNRRLQSYKLTYNFLKKNN